MRGEGNNRFFTGWYYKVMRRAEKATLVFNHKFLEYPTNYFVSTKIDEIMNKTPSKNGTHN